METRVDHSWWMQDGAPYVSQDKCRKGYERYIGNRIIGLGHSVEWPPRSPDLTPCDFFFFFVGLFEKQSL